MEYFHILLGCIAILTYDGSENYMVVPEESLSRAGHFLEIMDENESLYLVGGEQGYENTLYSLNSRALEIMEAPHEKNKSRFYHFMDRLDDLIENNNAYKKQLIVRAEIIGGYFQIRMKPLIKEAEEMDDMLKTVYLLKDKRMGVYTRRVALKKLKELYPEVYNLQVTPQLRRWEFR